MPALQQLYLHGNQIASLSPMRGLPSLGLINLSFNCLQHASQLSALTHLPGLRELYLNGNTLELDPMYNTFSTAFCS